MSTLLYSLGRWSFRHPWRVLTAWLLLLLVVGGGALGLGKSFDNSFSIPGTEAQEGLQQLERTFPEVAGTSAQGIVVTADGDSATDEAYRDPIEDFVDAVSDLDEVSAATSPYDDSVDGTISDDGTAAIIRVQLDGESTTISDDAKDRIESAFADMTAELPDGAQSALGGDLFATELPAVTITEAFGVIVALIVLIVAFRAVAMAGVPLGVALLGVGVSMLGIVAATGLATISSTTPLLALMLGLAVGIDYSLFIGARHQDQVREGVPPEESAARATGTAGSAVVFAGVTVLIALIGLGFAGIPFLTTMGIAAAVAVAIAVAISITLTPAFLGFVGSRAAGRPPRARKKPRKDEKEKLGFARRWVGLVTRHPIVTTVTIVLGLGIVAIPAAQLALALPNAGSLPEDSDARQAYDLTGEHFGEGFNGPLILTGSIITSDDPVGVMEDLADEVEKIDGVAEVPLATPNETIDTGIVQIVPETGPSDPETADLVRELRSHHDEWLDEFGIDLKVTGFTAVSIDISDQLGDALLPFGIFVVGLSFILLMIVFRSIWVPLKAALGYLLSILAAFGVVTMVFEWGWGADLLHIAKTGPVIAFMPIVAMGVLFGLAMDYEVFLVSRMREDYVHAARRLGPVTDRASRRAANRLAVESVRTGYAASARVVTAAAIIMFAVFAAFVPEGDSNIKPIALALAVGIAIDAFLIRMTLVPAVMALLGRHAWWMPRWLERLLPHFDVEGEAVERERRLADWPEPGSTAVIAADDLRIAVGDRVLVDGLDLRLEPGEAMIVQTPDERAARAVAVAVAGRTASQGLLRVAGHLMPGRASWVRSHVGMALFDDSTSPADATRQALRGSPPLVVLDGIDRLGDSDRDQLAAALRDAAHAADPAHPVAVLVTATDERSARSVLASAGWPDPLTHTTTRSEVNA
ncbi:MMPL family transporter [Microbacterium halotolerans]|uniref:MMPL family transporter n=1 Tax=Microbacterium halotolerans TaxID=246613 RepID=UPI000E6AD95C|nr:MMPL family transporter [Microbacterium halotolerans]